MASNSGKCSPMEVNDMLESMQQKAKEEKIPMNTYLTVELNIPEDEAPLLRKALSYLDTLSKPNNGTSTNAAVATVNSPNAPAAPAAPAVGGRRSRRNKNRKNKSRRGRR